MKTKSLWKRIFGQLSDRRAGVQAAFQNQFDTRLQFRELEPRVVLAADAIYDAMNQTLTITVEDGDSIEIGRDGMDNFLYVSGLDSSSGDGVFAAGKLTLDTTTLNSITIVDTNSNNNATPSAVAFLATLSNGPDLALTTGSTTLDNVDSVSVDVGAEVRVGGLDLLSSGTNTDDSVVNIQGAILGNVFVDVTNTNAKTLDVVSTAQGSVTAANFTINREATAGAVQIDLELGTHDLDSLAQSSTSAEVSISLTDVDDVELGDIVADSLTVEAGGTIQDTATTQINVSGVALLQATAITLNNSVAGHDFHTLTLSTTAGDAKLAESNGFELDGANSIAGNLQIDAGGSIQQVGGTLTVTQATTIVVADNADVTLNLANDFAGEVSVDGETDRAGTVTLHDTAGDLALGLIHAQVLDVTSAGATLQGSGNLDISAISNFVAGGTIALESGTNQFNGAVSAKSVGFQTSLADTDAIVLGEIMSGSLKVNAGGAVSQAGGAKIITGAADISAVGHSVTLNSANNDFSGSFSATGTAISVHDTNALELGAIAATSLSIVAKGAITQTIGEAIVVSTTADFTAIGKNITLANGGNDFQGSVDVAGAEVTLQDSGALELGEIAAGKLSVQAGAAITQSAMEKIVVTGETSLNAGGSITLENSANDFQASLSASGTAVSVVDVNSLELRNVTADSLEVTAGKNVTQAVGTALDIETTTDVMTDNGFDVLLANAGNDFGGAVSVTGILVGDVPNQVSITDLNALTLGNIRASKLYVLTGGDLDQALASTIQAGETTIEVADGQNVTLFNTGNDFTGAVSITSPGVATAAGEVKLLDDNTLELGTIEAQSLGIQAGGNVFQKAATTLQVAAETTVRVGNLADVTLFNAGNDFGGLVSVLGIDAVADTPGAVSLRDDVADGMNVALTLGDLRATSLAIQAAGTITQPTDGSTAIVVTTGSTDLTLTAQGDIDLRYGDNDIFTDLGLGKTFTVTLPVVSNLENFHLRNISSGAILPQGELPAALAAGNIDNVTLDFENSPALDLPEINVNEELMVIIGGDLTQGGDISVGKNASFDAGTITLADANDLKVVQNASFVARLGDIEVGVVSTANNAFARGADAGTVVSFGTLTFSATDFDVTIAEDRPMGDATPGMDLAGTNVGKSVVLRSGTGIETDAGASLTVTDLASFTAEEGSIQLGTAVDEAVDLRIVYAKATGNISIHEQADTNGLAIIDGTRANLVSGTLAVKTDGPIIQVNDFRTGAPVNQAIAVRQALLDSGSGILLTSLDVDVLAASAAGTPLFVTPGLTFDLTSAGLSGSNGFGGTLLTDAIDSDLPDENTDPFAAAAQAHSFVDGAGENYSLIAVNQGNLTIAKVADPLGDIGEVNGLETNGAASGHVFVRTMAGGDLTFGAAGSSSIVVDLTNSGVITALASGKLTISDGFQLHSSKGAGGVGDLFAVVSKIVQFDDMNLPPPNTQYEIDDPASWGPAYIRITGTSETYLLDTSTGVDTKAAFVLTQLGEAGEMDFVLVTDWRLTSNPAAPAMLDFQNVIVIPVAGNIDTPTQFEFVYPWEFATTHASVTILVSAYNSPQINLFENVDAMNPTNLNVVNDSFTMYFKTPIDNVPLIETYVPPAPPVVVPPPIELPTMIVTSSLVEVSGESRAATPIEGVTVVEVDPQRLSDEIGEEIKLDGEFMTLDAVKELIQRDERFRPGVYRITIVYPGVEKPQVAYFEKHLRAIPADIFGQHTPPRPTQAADIAAAQPRENPLSAEEVWAREYEKWFPAVVVERTESRDAVPEGAHVDPRHGGGPSEDAVLLERVSQVDWQEIDRMTQRLRAKHTAQRDALGSAMVGGAFLMAAAAAKAPDAAAEPTLPDGEQSPPKSHHYAGDRLDRLRRRLRQWL